jgi:phenylacetate-CoA ligase
VNPWAVQFGAARSFLRQHSTREQVIRFQNTRLRQLIAHACRRVPYYRRLFDRAGLDPRDVRTVADLARIPITTKEDMRAAQPGDTVARGVDVRRLVADTTSGISGDPFTVRRTRLERYMTVLFWLRAFRSYGLRATDRRASVVYSPAAHPRHRGIAGRMLGRIGVYRNLAVNSSRPAADIVRALEAYRPDFVSGYTGTIWHVAQELCRAGPGAIRPRAVTVGAETLTDPMRRTIREAFCAPVYDMYATHELNLVAWQCPETGDLHNCDDGLIVEVLTDGRPAEPGETGELVGTNLYSFALPFIRYRLGDVVTQGSPVCACGLPFSTLRRVEGRMVEYLVLPGGRWLHQSGVVRPILAGAAWIRRMQIVQEREDRVTVRLAPLSPPPAAELRRIEAAFREMLGPGVEAEVAVVPEIKPGPGGKYRLIVPMAGA